MRTGRTLGTALLLASAIVSASAQSQDRFLGADLGVFLPQDSALRSELGDSWFSIGASTFRNRDPRSSLLGTNWNAISKSANGNKVFMLSFSLGTFQTLAGGRIGSVNRSGGATPYVALRGGLSYIDYAVGSGLGRVSAKRIGYNANAEVGVMFGDRLTLSARYDFMPEYDGLNFSGISFQLRYGLVQF